MNAILLQKEYNTLVSSLSCCVTEEDYEKLHSSIEAVEHMAEIENRSVSLYDINTKTFLLKSHKHLDLLGYTDKELAELSAIEKYHSIVHPDDAVFLYESEIKFYHFLKPMKGGEKKNYKLIYDYRLKSKNNTYIRFLQQFMIFETDRNNRSWIMLVVTDVLSALPEDAVSKRLIVNIKTKEIRLFNEEGSIGKRFLTKREREILYLISQGMDSASIAKTLYISVCTVNNHRQHILEKTSAKNIAQSLAYCTAAGLL